jgi:hypothetical protein
LAGSEVHYQESENEHRNRKQHSHCYVSGKEAILADLDVRLAKEFDKNAGSAIEGDESTRQKSWGPESSLAIREIPKDQAKGDALQAGFIELTWVPRIRAAIGKDHRPWNVRNPAVQFAVDEIRDPAKK